MVKRERVTQSAVRIVRGLPNVVKVIIAIGVVTGTLYGAVSFVAGVEYDRREKARQKIGREEFTKYKAGVEKAKDEIDRKLEKLDDRIDDVCRNQ